MILSKEISYDDVLNEWMLAERYKLGDEPTIEALEKMRPALIKPLRELAVRWYQAEIEDEAAFNRLRMVRWSDWEECTGGTFNITDVPANLYRNPDHQKDVLAKKAELERAGRFASKVILFGGSEDAPTIIEGNHRMAAYKLYGDERGYSFLPLQVILGISPESHTLSLCQDYKTE